MPAKQSLSLRNLPQDMRLRFIFFRRHPINACRRHWVRSWLAWLLFGWQCRRSKLMATVDCCIFFLLLRVSRPTVLCLLIQTLSIRYHAADWFFSVRKLWFAVAPITHHIVTYHHPNRTQLPFCVPMVIIDNGGRDSPYEIKRFYIMDGRWVFSFLLLHPEILISFLPGWWWFTADNRWQFDFLGLPHSHHHDRDFR